jgi:RNA polymerase sigma-70 factor (ECF subfamily)
MKGEDGVAMLRSADDPLIQGLAEGREEAFAVLYDRFAASLFQVALISLGSPHDAEDAVQEVFIGLLRARARLRNVENLRAYLFASLRRAVAKLATSPERQRSVSPDELLRFSAPQPAELEIDRSLQLERALRRLPPEQREVLALKIDGGLTFAEIASVVGVSSNTVASRYRYALEKLRTALET